jgi:hypothetical protein
MVNMNISNYPFYLRLTCALCLFFSLHTSAEIKVGDEALLRLSYFPDLSGVYSYKQFEVIEVDKTLGTYKYKEIFFSHGSILYELTKSDRLVNISNAAANYKNCESSHIGKYETILVPAGSFIACHVSFRAVPSMDPDELYFGDVPFGLVKKSTIISSAGGISMEEELMSFSKQ